MKSDEVSLKLFFFLFKLSFFCSCFCRICCKKSFHEGEEKMFSAHSKNEKMFKNCFGVSEWMRSRSLNYFSLWLFMYFTCMCLGFVHASLNLNEYCFFAVVVKLSFYASLMETSGSTWRWIIFTCIKGTWKNNDS